MKSFQKIRISNYPTKLVDFQSFEKYSLQILTCIWKFCLHFGTDNLFFTYFYNPENPKPRNPMRGKTVNPIGPEPETFARGRLESDKF